MKSPISPTSFDQLFREARSYNRWADEAVDDATLHELYELVRLGPTSANCCPARFVFVRGDEARARLVACVSKGNEVKVRTAPVVVIIGMDLDFRDKLGELFPHEPGARDWFADPEVARTNAFRNSTLQGAYLILAARGLGLDCGPMSGFDNDRLDAAFFAGTAVRSNFICALGMGTTERLFPRSPRLKFDDACRIL